MNMNPGIASLSRCASAMFIAFAAVGAAAVIESTAVPGKIKWIHSYAEGQKLARESGKPMFVVFRCER
jgi:hypothetical protein